MTLYLIDVTAENQPGLDFVQAVRYFINGAFLKLTQGQTGVPRGTGEYVKRADAVVDVLGGYHFLDATISGASQAEMFVNAGRRMLGGWRDRLAAVDFEWFKGDGWDLTATNVILRDFVHAFKQLTGGHRIICYTTRNFWLGGVPTGDPSYYGIDAMWESQVFYETERRNHPANFYEQQWLPWYAGQPRLAYDSAPTLFRQFTWGAEVGGIWPVDADAFEGTESDLKAFTR